MSVTDNKQPTAHNETINQLQQEADALSARILLLMLADPERKQRLQDVIRHVLAEKSGDGFFRRLSAGTVLKLLPVLMNSLTGSMTPENPLPELGRLLTTILQINNHQAENKSAEDKESSARRVTETIDAFLANLDLGELNQALDLSRDQAVLSSESLSAMLQDNHLGKLASLGPAAVSSVNLLAAVLNTFLRQIHDAPPDFVAGFLAGLINLLDADALAEFLNHKHELIRMLSVGDRLQGDGKTTVLEAAITEKSRQVLAHIDQDLFCKKETGTAELAESVNKSLRQAIADHPEFLQRLTVTRALSFNTRIRALKEIMKLLLDLPEESLAESLTTSITSLDTDDLSEVFSSTLTLLQKIHERQPGILGKLLANIVKTIDDDDLAAAADFFFQEAVAAVTPLAWAVMPPLLNGLAELLTASMEDAPDTTGPPLSRLFDILKTGEETK